MIAFFSRAFYIYMDLWVRIGFSEIEVKINLYQGWS